MFLSLSFLLLSPLFIFFVLLFLSFSLSLSLSLSAFQFFDCSSDTLPFLDRYFILKVFTTWERESERDRSNNKYQTLLEEDHTARDTYGTVRRECVKF